MVCMNRVYFEKDVKGQWNSCVYFVVAIQIQLTLRIIDVIFHTLGGKRSEMHRRIWKDWYDPQQANEGMD